MDPRVPAHASVIPWSPGMIPQTGAVQRDMLIAPRDMTGDRAVLFVVGIRPGLLAGVHRERRPGSLPRQIELHTDSLPVGQRSRPELITAQQTCSTAKTL